MKKLLMIGTLVLVSILACQANDSNTNNEVTKLREEMDLIKYYFESKGITLERIKQEKKAEETAHEIPVGTSPVTGAENPLLTIVEFSDFQCPYCARAVPEVQAILKKYPDKVRVVYKHFPLSFHKQAPEAHAAAMAAQNQGKFWEFRNALAPHYKELNKAKFIEIAKNIGLDMAKFEKEMVVGPQYQKTVSEDMSLGGKIGVRGTPSFYVNGKKFNQAMSLGAIEAMLRNYK